jgi:SAM-dependent methyltransferase
MMPKTREDFTHANRIAWNEVASRHAAHNNARLFEAFREPGFVTFEGDILATLQRIDVREKTVIQLGCNNGRETLSLRNMGAARCVGVDAAEEFLAHGREMIRIAGAKDEVELLRSDVYQLPTKFAGAFDLVLVTVGVLNWMPDIEAFFRVIRSLLKPGGKLVMEEMHPVLLMYEQNSESGLSSIQFSYFSQQIWEETCGLDYYGHAEYAARPSYNFMYRLDEIFMAAMDCGLQLEYFKELDYDISNFCMDLESSPVKPPLGFILVMENIAASDAD